MFCYISRIFSPLLLSSSELKERLSTTFSASFRAPSDSRSLISESSNCQQSRVWKGREVKRWRILTIYQPPELFSNQPECSQHCTLHGNRKVAVGGKNAKHKHTHMHYHTRTGLRKRGHKHSKARLIPSANIFICVSSPFLCRKILWKRRKHIVFRYRKK